MGVGSSHPAPSFPLRRKILAQGGSLLMLVCLVLHLLLLAHISQSVLSVVACCLMAC